jgi:hypothetical protein
MLRRLRGKGEADLGPAIYGAVLAVVEVLSRVQQAAAPAAIAAAAGAGIRAREHNASGSSSARRRSTLEPTGAQASE